MIKKPPPGHSCTTNDNHMMYGSWDIKRNRQNFCQFELFFPFCPPPSHNPENQHFFKKEKQPWRYFHFKHEYHKSKSYDVYDSWDMNHMWTINDISYENHMIYGSWDINCNREIFLSSWVIFCPFTPLTAQKWI